MIIVELMGGLGNQMFQYAAAKSLAIKHQVPLKLDTKYLLDRSNPRPDFVFRNYDLDIWNIVAEFATDEEILEITGEITKYSPKSLSFLQKIHWRIKHAATDYKSQLYREPHFEFDENFYLKKPPLYLQGYWQSEKYFANIIDTIRKDFSFKETLSENCIAIQKQIQGLENLESVCLNVRRGDFVNIPKTSQHSGFVGLEYLYKGAEYIAQHITKNGNIPNFFVFSDEIDWCEKHIKLNYPTTFIAHEYAGTKFKDYLELMTTCKHFVIPNSSFGWWAAWLAKNPTKIVITPQQWFADKNMNSRDLIPQGWLKM